MKTVWRVSAQIAVSSSWIAPRVRASSAPKGSSSRSIFGWIAKARAMPTRCFMPPDRAEGFLSSLPVRRTRSMYFWQWASTFSRPQSGQRDFTAKAMFRRTVSQGMSAWPWKTTPRSRLGPATSRPSMITSPPLAASRPARMLRMVVLPQPEWPITQTNSPRSSAKETLSKTGAAPGAKRLARPRTCRKAALIRRR